MKKTNLPTAVAVLLLAVAAPVLAVPPGWGVPVDPGPVEPDFGTWKARVKQVNPRVINGHHYTWSYHDIVATSQVYCDQQLATWVAGGNVSVVEYCHKVN